MNLPIAPRKTQGKVQESNIDLFILAARYMSDGDPVPLLRAGLAPRDIPHLRQLSLSALMVMSKQGADLHAFLRRARGDIHRNELIQALMQLGAPRELMVELFHMSTRRYSAERIRLGVIGPRGRPMTARMDAATEQSIWRLWITLGSDQEPGILRGVDDWLLIAREVPGRLRSAWSLIQRWSRDPDALSAFRGDRLRITRDRLSRFETEIRRKHGLDHRRIPPAHTAGAVIERSSSIAAAQAENVPMLLEN